MEDLSEEKEQSGRPKRKRRLYFDILWVISIIVVIFTYSDGVLAYASLDPSTWQYSMALFLTLFAKFPLWLCLMISGAILLDMHEAIRTVWRKRISRLLIILVAFSFLYYLNDVMKGRDTFDLVRFIPDLYARDRVTQYWYMYASLGFMICLPFMRPMVKNMRDVDFVYLILAVFTLSSILPLFDLYVLKDRYYLNPSMKLEWVTEVIFIYPVMGYFLHYRLSTQKCRKLCWILIPLDLAWLVYNTHIYKNSGVSVGSVYMYPEVHGSTTMLHCVTLFITAKAYFKRMEQKKWELAIGSLGGCSFGIYLLFGFFLDGRVDLIEKLRLNVEGEATGLALMGRAMLWSIITYFACYIPVWLLRRIPGLRDMTL